MVKTGYIAFYEETAPTQDDSGNWIGGGSVLTDFIKCNLQVIKKEYIFVVDGLSKQASYSMYIDSDLITVDLSTISKVSLRDNLGHNLGDFQIQNPEHLVLSKRVKLVV